MSRTLTLDRRKLPVKASVWEMEMATTATYYRYGAGGERYWKQVGSQAPEYSVLAGGTASSRSVTVGVFTGTSGQTLRYWNIVSPSGETVGRILAGNVKRFYVKDHLGSTRAVVDESDNVVEMCNLRSGYRFGT